MYLETQPGEVSVQISPVFHSSARFNQACDPDIVLVSSDNGGFYVHSPRLLAASGNSFAGLLPVFAGPASRAPPVVHVADDAATLDVVLRAVYLLPVDAAAVPLDVLARAVDAGLRRYALPAPPFVAPGTCPVFDALMAHAVARGVGGAQAVYTIAARNGLEPLAVAASELLLSLDISTITDDWSIQLVVLNAEAASKIRSNMWSSNGPQPRYEPEHLSEAPWGLGV
ncbi:hypothetical protein BKA62DRAFT_672002 [Auriculariales sp. MPI-PUGE-AT-0066]|nr:hypothetical protein BKA62DRAFT_672002 [Auriculariales sp. MPI-PUGE-AT-0066]